MALFLERSSVIGVGHSYGASLINQHTVAYPSDFHSVILLGYSHVLNPTFPALLNLTQAPSKGTNLPNLNKASNSYLVHATIQDRINAFYTVGNFDQAILEYDNANEGIFTIGEILTLQSNQVTAPKFSGNVAYFNGQEDVGFGIKDLNDERPFWPKAKSISFNTYPKTGHGILAHLNAKQVQKDINAFVAKVL
ncbi:hypothetical protein BT69DRAFT_73507 [Atractiella rhizophila]|nr:hypothetical protein BT69DRAFT_73507 [Atractiella rhizophila]